MASLTYYGTSNADATLSTACTMVNATGGTETTKQTTFTGSNNWGEVVSKGGSIATVTAIPATPTGKGWIFYPGAGTFATGNWSASCALKAAIAGDNDATTIRFFRYSGGSYTQIGTINSSANNTVGTTRTVLTFSNTSMSSITLGASDGVYIDLWWEDTGGASGDNPSVYESSTTSTGVASDMQITTSNFTASGGGVTHRIICDGLGGMFV